MSSHAAPLHEPATVIGRYRLRGLLGEGANGKVFAAEHPDLGMPVALKVLRTGEGDATDLKREFRLVADLGHDNLVLPYSLESDGAQVFITMELIDGEPILDWAARLSGAERARSLRDAVRQTADGLVALHARGLIHRDIKPSNILVEPSGRVAILDFGLVRRVEADRFAAKHYFVGTPAYFAPELFDGSAANAATDAYALGVVLHQALTGSFPFHPSIVKSVSARLTEPAPTVACDDLELARLCQALLVPDPAGRVTLEEVLAELQPASAPRRRVRREEVIARDAELERLTHAFEHAVADRRTTVVHLPGASGMGKSALLRAFATRIAPRAWVLEGRAQERDSVPYKAMDAAMDQLAERVALLSDEARSAIRPAHAEGLHHLFPALGKAFDRDVKSDAPGPADASTATTSLLARRRKGADVLVDVLSRVSEQFGLVLTLDDLQWGDLDSAHLLADLLLAMRGIPMLLVLAYRAEHTDSPFLTFYRRWESEHVVSETVPVGPLALDAATRMAAALTGGHPRDEAIAREADGCPFLVEMLADTPDTSDSGGFKHALDHRLQQLSPAARQMLEAVCLAARPIQRGIVPFAPSNVPTTWAAWAALFGRRLICSRGVRADDSVEVYHDRIRDAVTQAMAPDARRATHAALGETFAASGDAEGAASHFAASGERARAFPYAESAARAALSALAFHRAAQLFKLCIECCPADDVATRRRLTLERARALVNAGHGTEAAPVLLEVAGNARDIASQNLRREAMEQYLFAGRVDDGVPIMDALLHELDVWRPPTWMATTALYAEVALLLARGPKPARSRPLSSRERLLLDTFVSIGTGFASYEASVGSWFFVRAVRRSLDWGERRAAARGIAYVGALLSFSGSPAFIRRAEAWVTAGEKIAAAEDDGHGMAYCHISRGMIACCTGQWQTAVDTFDEAARTLDAKYPTSVWEADLAKNTSLFALAQLGDLGPLEDRAVTLTRAARERGDLALEVEANLYLALASLGRDGVADALRCVERNLALWTVRGYHFQHWIALRFATLANLYAGHCERALAQMDDELPRARDANLTSMQVVRIEARDLHGRAALGSAAQATGTRRAELMRRAKADADALAREQRAHATAPSEMLHGGLALLDGLRHEACWRFRRAAGAYEVANMRTHELTARWLLATVGGDAGGKGPIEAELRSRGVVEPARWARMNLGVETSG